MLHTGFPSSAVSAPKVSARESSKLQRNRAALGSKIRFDSRRFDVQKALAAPLNSVDRGTGRNLADFGLTPRQVQVTGIAFVTASTSARQYQLCKDVAPFGTFGAGKTPSNCIARTLAKLLCPA